MAAERLPYKHPFTPLVGGRTDPFEKYESKWVYLPPIFGVKIPNIFELPPPRSTNQEQQRKVND